MDITCAGLIEVPQWTEAGNNPTCLLKSPIKGIINNILFSNYTKNLSQTKENLLCHANPVYHSAAVNGPSVLHGPQFKT